jgi:hypothetical protein
LTIWTFHLLYVTLNLESLNLYNLHFTHLRNLNTMATNKTRLTPKDIADMKVMAMNGVMPEDIANYFGIARITVHGYKKLWKDEGLKLPNLRGKRPLGYVPGSDNDPEVIQKQEKLHIEKLTATGNNDFKLIFNGTSINISSDALEVNITKKGVEVVY